MRHQGETIASRLAPPRSGVLRERRSELALDPALERIASGLGSGGAPPDQPEVPAAANGTAANGASPQARVKPLRPPTPAPADALEGHPPGTTAGTLDARHRPRAGHLPQHGPPLCARRRPTRTPGCGIIYRVAIQTRMGARCCWYVIRQNHCPSYSGAPNLSRSRSLLRWIRGKAGRRISTPKPPKRPDSAGAHLVTEHNRALDMCCHIGRRGHQVVRAGDRLTNVALSCLCGLGGS